MYLYYYIIKKSVTQTLQLSFSSLRNIMFGIVCEMVHGFVRDIGRGIVYAIVWVIFCAVSYELLCALYCVRGILLMVLCACYFAQ